MQNYNLLIICFVGKCIKVVCPFLNRNKNEVVIYYLCLVTIHVANKGENITFPKYLFILFI